MRISDTGVTAPRDRTLTDLTGDGQMAGRYYRVSWLWVGRLEECAVLDELLASARQGLSRTVIRGEASKTCRDLAPSTQEPARGRVM